MFDAYYLLKSTSDDLVSVEVSAEFERAKESKLDDEDEKRRNKILENIIKIYTESNFEFPPQTNTIYHQSSYVSDVKETLSLSDLTGAEGEC